MNQSAVLSPDAFDAAMGVTPDVNPEPVVATPDVLPKTPDETPAPVPDAEASEAGRVLASKKVEKRHQSIQAKINAARREQTEAETAAAHAKAELARIERERQHVLSPGESKPTEDQFSDYAEFVDARARWISRQEFAQLEAQRDAARAQTVQATEMQRLEQAHIARYQSFIAADVEAQDLIDAASDPEDADAYAPASRPMQDAIVRSPQGPAIMKYLAQHPAEARTMAQLPPLDAFAAVVRLESRFGAASSGPASDRPRSSAPPPIKPVAGVPTQSDLAVTADTPIEDFIRVENSRERRRYA